MLDPRTALEELKEMIAEELELGGDASTIATVIDNWAAAGPDDSETEWGREWGEVQVVERRKSRESALSQIGLSGGLLVSCTVTPWERAK